VPRALNQAVGQLDATDAAPPPRSTGHRRHARRSTASLTTVLISDASLPPDFKLTNLFPIRKPDNSKKTSTWRGVGLHSLTPGGCQIGYYMNRTGCHQLDLVTVRPARVAPTPGVTDWLHRHTGWRRWVVGCQKNVVKVPTRVNVSTSPTILLLGTGRRGGGWQKSSTRYRGRAAARW
jgi:hypothetical protein